jgi:polyferredoxin
MPRTYADEVRSVPSLSVAIIERLLELDRRLGLGPKPWADRAAARWLPVYLVASAVAALVGLMLFLTGHPSAAWPTLLTVIPLGVSALRGWTVRQYYGKRPPRPTGS